MPRTLLVAGHSPFDGAYRDRPCDLLVANHSHSNLTSVIPPDLRGKASVGAVIPRYSCRTLPGESVPQTVPTGVFTDPVPKAGGHTNQLRQLSDFMGKSGVGAVVLLQ